MIKFTGGIYSVKLLQIKFSSADGVVNTQGEEIRNGEDEDDVMNFSEYTKQRRRSETRLWDFIWWIVKIVTSGNNTETVKRGQRGRSEEMDSWDCGTCIHGIQMDTKEYLIPSLITLNCVSSSVMSCLQFRIMFCSRIWLYLHKLPQQRFLLLFLNTAQTQKLSRPGAHGNKVHVVLLNSVDPRRVFYVKRLYTKSHKITLFFRYEEKNEKSKTALTNSLLLRLQGTLLTCPSGV